MAVARRAVILDKDGTLVEDVPYNTDPERVRLAARAGEALRLLQDAGYELLVASNQSGIARGYFDENELAAAWTHLEALIADEGVRMSGFFWCPHHPDGIIPKFSVACGCRKPAPGLLIRAAETVGVPPARCWMAGDILDDIEAGRRAGMRTVLIDNGNETEWLASHLRTPDRIAGDIYAAAAAIIQADRLGACRRSLARIEAEQW
jgi:histidinol-phosphate phosphatase family protein